MKLFNTCWIVIACVFANVNTLCADDGDPVAIRTWPDGGVTIETMWNLHLGYRITEANKMLLPRPLDLNLYLATVSKPGETVLFGRSPNDDQPSRIEGKPQRIDENDIAVSREKSGPFAGSIAVKVNGLTIHILNGVAPEKLTASLPHDSKETQPTTDHDANTVFVAGATFDQAAIQKIAAAFKPRLMIVPPEITQIGSQKVISFPHNTLAVSAAADKDDSDTVTRFVSLADEPYEMSDEVSELFEKKETACKGSRETFAKLSIEQMNFQPPNGTHTPRWNSEHMMGRELLFFSQIYHAVDPTIPVMDLNPRQMPDDYKMAHPDWMGAEEARQTERVEAFTRRFAYLLDGMPLNRKAKGSKFWTPKALLKQMERHYNEHTANVEKKMQLDEWPKQ
ncbi:DinB family protein [Mariniblastus sp.]|nr:DinB family protein [Mariniblastus sp.]